MSSVISLILMIVVPVAALAAFYFALRFLGWGFQRRPAV